MNERMYNRIKKVASGKLADTVKGFDPLAVALYFSNDNERYDLIECLENNPEAPCIWEAAVYATAVAEDSAEVEEKIWDGYFADQLNDLLKQAKRSKRVAARLTPVFCEAQRNARKYRLPWRLKAEIKDFLESQREKDGFLLFDLKTEYAFVQTQGEIYALHR